MSCRQVPYLSKKNGSRNRSNMKKTSSYFGIDLYMHGGGAWFRVEDGQGDYRRVHEAIDIDATNKADANLGTVQRWIRRKSPLLDGG